MAKSKKIPMTKMAQYRHVKFLISVEKQAMLAYNYTAIKLIIAIKKKLTAEKLAKSTNKVPWQTVWQNIKDNHTGSVNTKDAPHMHEAVSKHPHWELQHVPLTSLHMDVTQPMDEKEDEEWAVNSYAPLKTKAPPITLYHKDGKFGHVDGRHRSRAAHLRGETHIAAYVPAAPKLAKSEDDLKRGWTGEVPKIEADLEALLGPTIDKHMDALRWALLGNYAGKDAAEAAEDVGLKDKVTPGVIPSAYLQSLDSHREHFHDLFDTKPAAIPKELVKESLSQIVKKASRFVDQLLLEFKNKVISSVDGTFDAFNFENINTAFETAKETASVLGGEAAVEKAGQEVNPNIKKAELTRNLDHIVAGYEGKFETAVRTNTSLASAIGTHQSMLELYGRSGDELRVVNMEMEDERVCTFCHKISKDSRGWIYYKLGELQPSGYNFFRKRSEWAASIAPQHYRCRCQTVYVPPGFEIDANGTMSKKV